MNRVYQPISKIECSAVIPALNPDGTLLTLIQSLKEEGFENLIVVDDGSGTESQEVFGQAAALGARCLRHPRNRGKGAALRTGFRYFLEHNPGDVAVITLDADGQHSAVDAAALARICRERPGQLILGTRFLEHNEAPIPLRSRLGNSISRVAIGMVFDQPLVDTQCGLRGIPRESVEALLEVAGDRYEFETNVLFWAYKNGLPILAAPVQTVYLEGNRSSHFQPFLDSMRIYFVVLRFYGSSLAAAILDMAIFIALWSSTGDFVVSAVLARALSSASNFLLNRRFVFRSQASAGGAVLRYYGLAVTLLIASTITGRWLVANGWNGVFAKIVADITLSVLSFAAQRTVVFSRGEGGNRGQKSLSGGC